jgi:hypothetical protein
MIHRIGLISDTHGLVRPEALAALTGCERIVHAGDIGSAAVLEALRELAPVIAVRGNNDRGAWAAELPATDILDIDGVLLCVLHDIHAIDLDPAASGFHAVVAGHSHRPAVLRKDGVLYVNPGSSGPRRFQLPVSVALLTIDGGELDASIVELDVTGSARFAIERGEGTG